MSKINELAQRSTLHANVTNRLMRAADGARPGDVIPYDEAEAMDARDWDELRRRLDDHDLALVDEGDGHEVRATGA